MGKSGESNIRRGGDALRVTFDGSQPALDKGKLGQTLNLHFFLTK